MAATLLLAGLSLAVGLGMMMERYELLQHGQQTEGVVVSIDVGAKGLRSVEAEYIARDGRRLIGRDLHKTQWYSSNEVGDEVVLYYDPFYEGQGIPDILIGRGLWIWVNPAFLLCAGVFLLWLGVYLVRAQRGKGGQSGS